jgi:hypothetical protein
MLLGRRLDICSQGYECGPPSKCNAGNEAGYWKEICR